jgi:hypothetical protein
MVGGRSLLPVAPKRIPRSKPELPCRSCSAHRVYPEGRKVGPQARKERALPARVHSRSAAVPARSATGELSDSLMRAPGSRSARGIHSYCGLPARFARSPLLIAAAVTAVNTIRNTRPYEAHPGRPQLNAWFSIRHSRVRYWLVPSFSTTSQIMASVVSIRRRWKRHSVGPCGLPWWDP